MIIKKSANAAPNTKLFVASFNGSIDSTGAFQAIVSGDFNGNSKGVLNLDGSFTGTFDGPVELPV
jgi:hypothetical protein